jgi:hypothetical protein
MLQGTTGVSVFYFAVFLDFLDSGFKSFFDAAINYFFFIIIEDFVYDPEVAGAIGGSFLPERVGVLTHL